MFSNYLSEEHLTHSDHAAPSSVTDIGAVDLIGQFGEAWSVGEPWSGSKDFEYLLSDLREVGLFGEEGVSEDVDLISFLEKGGFLVFFEVAEEIVPKVEGEILDALPKWRLSKGHENNYNK